MQEPTLEGYGLSPDDPARYERWEEWLSWLSLIGRVGIGGICGFLVGAMISDAVAFLGASVGAFVSLTDLGDRFEKSAIETLLPKLPRYQRFRGALSAFKSARKEAEEQELRARSEFWLSLSGHSFEHELAKLLEQEGYKVTRTPGSGDGGIDLVLRRSGRTIVVQCKQTRHPVGPAAARDLFGALMHCRADEGILAATAGVTSGVHEFFKGKPLRVMDLPEILSLQQHGRTPTA